MRVAAVQFAATTDVVSNLEALAPLVRDAARQGADLIVIPEGAMHDFGQPDLALGRVAQPVDGPFSATISELAREAGATVVAGMFERSHDAARPFNTLVAFGPAGDLLATYRKSYLYDSFGYRESDRLTAGDGTPVTVKTADLTLGLMTCYDLRFPELGRALVDAGAEVFVVPAAWVRGSPQGRPLDDVAARPRHREHLLRGRGGPDRVVLHRLQHDHRPHGRTAGEPRSRRGRRGRRAHCGAAGLGSPSEPLIGKPALTRVP